MSTTTKQPATTADNIDDHALMLYQDNPFVILGAARAAGVKIKCVVIPIYNECVAIESPDDLEVLLDSLLQVPSYRFAVYLPSDAESGGEWDRALGERLEYNETHNYFERRQEEVEDDGIREMFVQRTPLDSNTPEYAVWRVNLNKPDTVERMRHRLADSRQVLIDRRDLDADLAAKFGLKPAVTSAGFKVYLHKN